MLEYRTVTTHTVTCDCVGQCMVEYRQLSDHIYNLHVIVLDSEC